MCYSTIDEQGQPLPGKACLSGAFLSLSIHGKSIPMHGDRFWYEKKAFYGKKRKNSSAGRPSSSLWCSRRLSAGSWGGPWGSSCPSRRNSACGWRATACGAKPPMWAWYFCRCWWPSSPASRWRSAADTPFGAVQGTVLCMLGAFLGSVVVFAFVRRFGRELVEVFSPRRRSSPCVFCRAPLSGICCSGSYSLCRERPRIFCATFAGLTDLSWGKVAR